MLLAPCTTIHWHHGYIADIFTSMPKIFADFLFTGCIYVTGVAFDDDFVSNKDSRGQCGDSSTLYRYLHIALSVLPFWIRFAQSVRKAILAGSTRGTVKDSANALKYVTSITVVGLSFGGDSVYNWWIAASIVSTVYAFCWDIFMDWGLGPAAVRQFIHGDEWGQVSDQRGLRPARMYPSWTYYVAAILNGAARCGWYVTLHGFASVLLSTLYEITDVYGIGRRCSNPVASLAGHCTYLQSRMW